MRALVYSSYWCVFFVHMQYILSFPNENTVCVIWEHQIIITNRSMNADDSK